MITPATPSSSAALQRLLDAADTVTHILEALTGEQLVADVVYQRPATAPPDDPLGVGAGRPLTERLAVLRGRRSGRAFVRARSLFSRERLLEPVRLRLARSTDPIGRILTEQGASVRREPLGPDDGGRGRSVGAVTEAEGQVVWSRSYLLLVDDRPTFLVHEDFLDSLLAADLGR